MKNTHTPGPWTISGIHHSIGIAPDDGKSDGLASVFGCGPQAEANAALIASAPDLLSALDEIIEHATRYGSAPISAVKMFDRARAAIAKAKGEA